MRVLGFTRGEVLRILLLELALLTLLAQPPGWAIGYGLAWIMKTRLAGELMRVRLVVEHFTYALTSIIVISAALFSALVVRTRVYGLDLVFRPQNPRLNDAKHFEKPTYGIRCDCCCRRRAGMACLAEPGAGRSRKCRARGRGGDRG